MIFSKTVVIFDSVLGNSFELFPLYLTNFNGPHSSLKTPAFSRVGHIFMQSLLKSFFVGF